jgi:phosphatidate cytidylyltransferase
MSIASRILERVVELTGLPAGVVLVLAGIFVALAVGSIVRLSHLHALPKRQGEALRQRLRTWWVIALLLTVVILLKRPATVAFMAVVSLLALREYLSLVPERRRYGSAVVWAYIAVPFQYLWIYLGWYELFIIFIPVLVFLLLTLRMVLMREPHGFLHMTGTLQWGMMILVFCLSHVAFLLSLSPDPNPAGGAIGLFLYLLLLTEFNDIAQAIWGRALGKHTVIREVSPSKSWEGLVGAVVCTTILAVLLAPVLTPLASTPQLLDVEVDVPFYLSPWAALAGLLIGIGGFFGDITMSAVKRDIGVKDSGTMLPGQGGVLDRIDSLTFTAPLFFHYVHFLYY